MACWQWASAPPAAWHWSTFRNPVWRIRIAPWVRSAEAVSAPRLATRPRTAGTIGSAIRAHTVARTSPPVPAPTPAWSAGVMRATRAQGAAIRTAAARTCSGRLPSATTPPYAPMTSPVGHHVSTRTTSPALLFSAIQSWAGARIFASKTWTARTDTVAGPVPVNLERARAALDSAQLRSAQRTYTSRGSIHRKLGSSSGFVSSSNTVSTPEFFRSFALAMQTHF